MDALPFATSLARALLTLARSRATGVLEIFGGDRRRRAKLLIVEGTPRAIEAAGDDEDGLGDLLAREGSLDLARHRAALAEGEPSGPVGEWLIATGAATRPAVVHALRNQLRKRIGALFAWTGAELRFRASAPDWAGSEPIDEPVDPGDLVLSSMRHVVAGVSWGALRKGLGDGALELTQLGEALVDKARLWPEELAMVALLRRGATVEALLAAIGPGIRAVRTLFAMKLLHAVAPPSPSDRSYRLLLRKAGEIRRAETAHVLLEVPKGASAKDARRALRRLASEIHPDRFSDEPHSDFRRISGDVLAALVRAQADVTSRVPR